MTSIGTDHEPQNAPREHLRALRELLDAKDPRLLSPRPKRGSVILVFVGEDQVERLSIRLGDRRVEVLEGGQSLPDEAVLLVRSTLSEWLRFCAEPNLEHLGQLELFGDLDLLQTVAKLIQAKRSAISARFFASEARRPVARTNRRRTRNAHH